MTIRHDPWVNFNVSGIRSPLLVLRGHEVIERLERRGIRVPSPNRLANAIKLTDDLNAGRIRVRADDDRLQNRVLEALRTLWSYRVMPG